MVDIEKVHEGKREPTLRAIADQAGDLHSQHTVTVACPCDNEGPLREMFRCLYCEVYFCPVCAEDHFEEEREVAVESVCPGCGDDIIVFPDGEVGESRQEPTPPGVLTTLFASAFKDHYCDANDREFICHGCHTRYEEEDKAKDCCKFDHPRREYSLVSEYDGEHAL